MAAHMGIERRSFFSFTAHTVSSLLLFCIAPLSISLSHSRVFFFSVVLIYFIDSAVSAFSTLNISRHLTAIFSAMVKTRFLSASCTYFIPFHIFTLHLAAFFLWLRCTEAVMRNLRQKKRRRKHLDTNNMRLERRQSGSSLFLGRNCFFVSTCISQAAHPNMVVGELRLVAMLVH